MSTLKVQKDKKAQATNASMEKITIEPPPKLPSTTKKHNIFLFHLKP